MTIGAEPVPELTVSAACDQPEADTAGKVADCGADLGVRELGVDPDRAAVGRPEEEQGLAAAAVDAGRCERSAPESRIVGAVRSAATVTGSGVVPVVVQVPTTAVTT